MNELSAISHDGWNLPRRISCPRQGDFSDTFCPHQASSSLSWQTNVQIMYWLCITAYRGKEPHISQLIAQWIPFFSEYETFTIIQTKRTSLPMYCPDVQTMILVQLSVIIVLLMILKEFYDCVSYILCHETSVTPKLPLHDKIVSARANGRNFGDIVAYLRSPSYVALVPWHEPSTTISHDID